MNCDLREGDGSDDAAARELIKQHHANMRKRMRDGKTVEEVWRENAEDPGSLLSYANAMRRLGNSWRDKGPAGNDEAERIAWILRAILDYYKAPSPSTPHTPQEEPAPAKRQRTGQASAMPSFAHLASGLVRPLLKAKRREHFEKSGERLSEERTLQMLCDLSEEHDIDQQRRIDVLDVGSCYNPLAEHAEAGALNIVPVDLQPAPETEVLRCDFTDVQFETLEGMYVTDSEKRVKSLRLRGFDAVVFCLLLSYMPCPRMRFRCVENAFTALRHNGLLVIVAPRTIGKRNNLDWISTWSAALSLLSFECVAKEVRKKIVCLSYRKTSPEACPPDVPQEARSLPTLADKVWGIE